MVQTLEGDGAFTAFASAIRDQYQPSTVLQTELIHRLVSILWRLRRAHAIETGLLSIQSKLQRDIRVPEHQIDMIELLGLETELSDNDPHLDAERRCVEAKARAFLRLINFNGMALQQLNQYEVALWRQAAQLILMLDGPLRRPLARPT